MRFCETRYLVDEYVARDRKVVGGWSVKATEDHPEWVLFAAWESWEHHYNFIKTEGFQEYGKILRFLDSYESKYVKIISMERKLP